MWTSMLLPVRDALYIISVVRKDPVELDAEEGPRMTFLGRPGESSA